MNYYGVSQERQNYFQGNSGHPDEISPVYCLPTERKFREEDNLMSTNNLAKNQTFSSFPSSAESTLPKIEMGQFFSDACSNDPLKSKNLGSDSNSGIYRTSVIESKEIRRITVKQEVCFDRSEKHFSDSRYHPSYPRIQPSLQSTRPTTQPQVVWGHSNPTHPLEYNNKNTQSASHPSLDSVSVDRQSHHWSAHQPPKLPSSVPELVLKSEEVPACRKYYSLETPFKTENPNPASHSNHGPFHQNNFYSSTVTNSGCESVKKEKQDMTLLNASRQSQPIPMTNTSTFNMNMQPQTNYGNAYPHHSSQLDARNGIQNNPHQGSKIANYRGSFSIYSQHHEKQHLQLSSTASPSQIPSNPRIVERDYYYPHPVITETKLRSMLTTPPLEKYVPMKPFFKNIQHESHQQNINNLQYNQSSNFRKPNVDHQQRNMQPHVYSTQKPEFVSMSSEFYTNRPQPIHIPTNVSTPISKPECVLPHGYTQDSRGINAATGFQGSNQHHQSRMHGNVPMNSSHQQTVRHFQFQYNQHQSQRIGEIKTDRATQQGMSQYTTAFSEKTQHANGPREILTNQKDTNLFAVGKIYPSSPTSRDLQSIEMKKKSPVYSLDSTSKVKPTETHNFKQIKAESLDPNESNHTNVASLHHYPHANIQPLKPNQATPLLPNLDYKSCDRQQLLISQKTILTESPYNFKEQESKKIENSPSKLFNKSHYSRVVESPIKFRTKGELKQITSLKEVPREQPTIDDPIISNDDWLSWSAVFSNEWEKFVNNLTAMKNLKRVQR